ncbi:hypothetical protein WJX82_009225 [Trebouxia sp. C0006]
MHSTDNPKESGSDKAPEFDGAEAGGSAVAPPHEVPAAAQSQGSITSPTDGVLQTPEQASEKLARRVPQPTAASEGGDGLGQPTAANLELAFSQVSIENLSQSTDALQAELQKAQDGTHQTAGSTEGDQVQAGVDDQAVGAPPPQVAVAQDESQSYALEAEETEAEETEAGAAQDGNHQAAGNMQGDNGWAGNGHQAVAAPPNQVALAQVDVDGDGILVVDADIAPPANLPVADWSEMIQYFIGQDDIGMVRGLCPYLGQAAISPAVVAVAFYSDNYQHLRSLLLACADAAPFKLKLRQYRDYQHAPSEEEYLTPLMHVAIHKGRWDQVETLLFAGVSPRLRATRVIGGTSPHHGALRCAQVRAVEELFRDCQNRVAQKQVTMTRAAFAHS